MHLAASVRQTQSALFAATIGLAVSVCAAGEYRFVLVDAFNPEYDLRECYIFDLSDAGVACGTATIRQGGMITYTGFHWTAEAGKTAVGLGWPKGISNHGVMAGVGQLYDIGKGLFINLPLLPNTYPPLVALGVNDAGQAVGYVKTCNGCSDSQGVRQIPYFWDPEQGAASLPVPGATGAARINSHGLVVGWIGGWNGPDGYVYDLNTNAHFRVSSLFSGQNIQTTVVDISENDVIVGARKEQNGQVTYGYTWSADSGTTLLPLPPPEYQPYVQPASINSRGVVVGSIFKNGSSRAFVYDEPNGIRDLTTLTEPPPGFTLMTATAVNERGWIAGYGYGGGGMYKSFMLIPQLPGDLNCDGSVDFGDINPFVLALSDPAGYAQQFPDCDIQNADINGDGEVNFGDVNPFVALLARM